MADFEERRNQRFDEATITALKDIHERAMQLPLPEHYPAAYGILRGYVTTLLTDFAEVFSNEQLAAVRIVFDQLDQLTGEDEHIDEATKSKLNGLAQKLRDGEVEVDQL